MIKLLVLFASYIFLLDISFAEEVVYRGVWADCNYSTMLMFDELSGRLMDIVIPERHEEPFQLRKKGVTFHITGFESRILIKRPPKLTECGTTNVINFKILGIESVRPKFIADYSVSMRKNEFTGGSCFIWDVDEAKNMPEELQKQEELLIYSRGQKEATRFDGKPIPAGNRILLDKKLHRSLVARMLASNPEPFHAPKYINEGNKNYRKTPLELVRHSDGRLETFGTDYAFEILLNRATGHLAVYIRYRNKEEHKDIDVSDIRPMIDHDRLSAAPWDYWNDLSIPRDRKISPAKMPVPALEVPGGISEDTVFTIRVNQVFGTVRPIWELAIWEELGRRIRQEHRAYILYFNDEDMQGLERPEISQSYLVMTDELYEVMETLRREAETRQAGSVNSGQ